jgi:hypothetical protein
MASAVQHAHKPLHIPSLFSSSAPAITASALAVMATEKIDIETTAAQRGSLIVDKELTSEEDAAVLAKMGLVAP